MRYNTPAQTAKFLLYSVGIRRAREMARWARDNDTGPGRAFWIAVLDYIGRVYAL